jgi:ribose transport system substrate-binding protein
MVDKVGENLYRCSLRPFKQKSIGSAMRRKAPTISSRTWSPSSNAPPRRAFLISLDNRYTRKSPSATPTFWCARRSISSSSTDEHVAPIAVAKYRDANSLIAIEVFPPGRDRLGANNYEAGLIGAIGRWAKQHWHADVDEIVLITLERAGSLPKMRLTGMLVGMKEAFPHLEQCKVTHLDGDGKFGESFEHAAVLAYRSRRSLVGAINDPSALSAARLQSGRTDSCATGPECSPEAVPGCASRGRGWSVRSPTFRSTAPSSPSRSTSSTGARLPAVSHQLGTPETVDHIYPNDELMLARTLRPVHDHHVQRTGRPLMRVISMSAVADGPEIVVTSDALATRGWRSPSGTVSTTWPAPTIQR